MAYIYRFLVLLLTCVTIAHVLAQEDCLPGAVENLRLYPEGILSWDIPSNEECLITYFIVYIGVADEDMVIWTFTPEENSLDVSFLIPCYGYTFRVQQVSSFNNTGAVIGIFETTPPPSDANLALEYLFVSRVDRNLRLDWSLEDQWITCARRYRILTYDEDNNVAVDFYTPLNSITMYNLIPCASYTFGVTALFSLEDEGPVSTIRTVAPEDYAFAPELQTYAVTSTNARLTLRLEELQTNRCPITQIRISSPGFTLGAPINNQANRTPFNLNITGLVPDTFYFLNITVNNTAGWSQPLLVGVQTTP